MGGAALFLRVSGLAGSVGREQVEHVAGELAAREHAADHALVLHTVHFVPVSLRGYSVELGCETRKVIGYRALCRCGARSQLSRSRAALREWAREHRREAASVH